MQLSGCMHVSDLLAWVLKLFCVELLVALAIVVVDSSRH